MCMVGAVRRVGYAGRVYCMSGLCEFYVGCCYFLGGRGEGGTAGGA